ncbi:MAG: T9SS type A sorting domain-containing protein [Flavobacteriaceae bacterium]|nr:T9SS type A sorting domain-containing protein [Flavobacteriaceae bacterium]
MAQFDLNGKRIINRLITESTPRINLDLSHLKGLYLLRISTARGQVIKKLVI